CVVVLYSFLCFLFLHAEDGIRDRNVTGVQTCALPISSDSTSPKTQGAPVGRSLSVTCGGEGAAWQSAGRTSLTDDGWERSARATVLDSGLRPPQVAHGPLRHTRPALGLLAVLLGGGRSTGHPVVATYTLPPARPVEPRLPGHVPSGRGRTRRGHPAARSADQGPSSTDPGQWSFP